MAKGASSGQASQMVPRGAGAGEGPRASGPPPGSVGAARRRPAGRPAGSRSSGSGPMNFYTDDAPGLKISPVMVLIMSVGFIGFVTLLHVIGKIRG